MTPPNYVPDPRRRTLKATAFHEAGHAFSAVHHNLPFTKVSIMKREEGETFADGTPIGEVTRNLDKPSFFGRLEDAKIEAIQAMVGPVAECLPYPGMQPDFVENAGDARVAESIIKFALLQHTMLANGEAKFDEDEFERVKPQIQQICNECFQRAVSLVNANVPAIARLAQELLTRFKLTEAEVQRLVRGPLCLVFDSEIGDPIDDGALEDAVAKEPFPGRYVWNGLPGEEALLSARQRSRQRSRCDVRWGGHLRIDGHIAPKL